VKLSAEGLSLLKQFEGLKLEAYPDPATNGDPWTIGFGHTGPDVHKGLTITEAEAEDLLVEDVHKFEQCVEDALELPATQHQFDSMVVLVYNIGCKAFSGSTLLRLFNDGNVVAAQQQFGRWNKAAGKEMAGLTRRRDAEADLFGMA
jgi:lysozyme